MAKWPFWGALMALVVAGSPAYCGPAAQKAFSVSSFGTITVLEDGRKKPLDTYARNKLTQFSGRQRFHGRSAIDWLARAVFDPQTADTEAVFLINNPEIVFALGIAPRPGRRYSFFELYEAQEKLNDQYQSARRAAAKDRSPFEREIVRVHDNFFEYGSISSMFSFFTPHEMFKIGDSAVAARLRVPKNKLLSYVDLLACSETFAQGILEIQKKRMGTDSLTASENALMHVANNMYQLVSSIGNPPPHCIVVMGDSGETWLSPWGFIARNHTAALTDKTMGALIQMREGYLDGDPKQFETGLGEFKEVMHERFPGKIPNPSLELLYNSLGPFSRSKIALGVAALLALIAVFSSVMSVYWVAMALVGISWILISAGIVLRMIILGHPPLASLYETFVFVSWLTIIIGMVLELMRLRPIGLITASITGFVFLHLAGKFAGDGDTMGTLIAVLDSSFWLTTHIITITLGYAGCVAAGVVSHVYLISKVIKKHSAQMNLQAMERAIYGILCFGTLFTVIGTILGGMWADQAWGRFWGWDPKENGALLIILWCCAVLHARSAGMMKGMGTAAGAIIGTMLVMCAWIGVNMLGIGLHSYGFTSAGVSALLTYLSLEIVFLFVMVIAFNSRATNLRA
jgi:cytochrome c-type biogenesis protein CcsB